MSLRARIFIIVSIIVLFILGVSIFLSVGRNKTAPQSGGVPAPTGQTGDLSASAPGSADTTASPGLPAKTSTPLEAEQNGVQQLAKVLVERYGTYSSDNNWQNIKDLQTLVTKSLWSKLNSQMKATSTGAFVGVTTKVIGMDLTQWSDAKAVIKLKTVRTEEKNGKITTRYQDATVEMVKQNDFWLGDKLTWN